MLCKGDREGIPLEYVLVYFSIKQHYNTVSENKQNVFFSYAVVPVHIIMKTRIYFDTTYSVKNSKPYNFPCENNNSLELKCGQAYINRAAASISLVK